MDLHLCAKKQTRRWQLEPSLQSWVRYRAGCSQHSNTPSKQSNESKTSQTKAKQVRKQNKPNESKTSQTKAKQVKRKQNSSEPKAKKVSAQLGAVPRRVQPALKHT
jgi:hypothetical protein